MGFLSIMLITIRL